MAAADHREGRQYAPEHGGRRTERRGVNRRAVMGYGPLIIEFADVVTNGVVLALTGARDFYKAGWTEAQHFYWLKHIQYAGFQICAAFFFSSRHGYFLEPSAVWLNVD